MFLSLCGIIASTVDRRKTQKPTENLRKLTQENTPLIYSAEKTDDPRSSASYNFPLDTSSYTRWVFTRYKIEEQ